MNETHVSYCQAISAWVKCAAADRFSPTGNSVRAEEMLDAVHHPFTVAAIVRGRQTQSMGLLVTRADV